VAGCGIGFLISRKSTEKFAGIMQPLHDTMNKTELQTEFDYESKVKPKRCELFHDKRRLHLF